MDLTVLYIGDHSPASTSRHRADALRRIGCKVTILDPAQVNGSITRLRAFLDYRTGYYFRQSSLLRQLQTRIAELSARPGLVWVNGGELLGPRIIRWLRSECGCPVILYQNDDPLGNRDGNRFLSLKSSLPYYDLCVFVRLETQLEALAIGAKRTLRVFMSYDEHIHASPSGFSSVPKPIVSFIGARIPGENRDHFLLTLLNAGLPISLIGNRWNRSRYWPVLKNVYHGPARFGTPYSQALASAAVSLGFLSHQNRDLTTTRSFETPACGGLLCAERTSEHQLLYEQTQDAIFWSSSSECIQECRNLLRDPRRNQQIRVSGLNQVFRLGVGNEDICRQILASL